MFGGYSKYAVNKTISVAGCLDYLKEDSIDGEDPGIMKMMAPTSDPDNYGGTRIDATIDVTGMFGGHTFGLGYTKSLKQDTNGPQNGAAVHHHLVLDVYGVISFSYNAFCI